MPVTPAQMTNGANYQLETYSRDKPMDQFTIAHPFAQWLIDHKQESVFSNGVYNEEVRFTNDSNYQNYDGSDQVSFNHKDTVRKVPFQHYNAHDGFALDETELANNGIVLTDDKNAVLTEAEEWQIVNKLQEGYDTLQEGFQENWNIEVHRDGTQSSKAVPGLDLLVSMTPTVSQIIGGFDQSLYPWWQNNASTNSGSGIPTTAGALITEMEKMWRACIRYGGSAPDFIIAGSTFVDRYRADSEAGISRYMPIPPDRKEGVNLDPSVGMGVKTGLYFKGVEIIWDPTMETLATVTGTANWIQRCYMLNSKHMRLRPFKGRWMINRKPPRMYDRYVFYFGLTADYGITVKKRNSMAVLLCSP
jgi:hypothetical protein